MQRVARPGDHGRVRRLIRQRKEGIAASPRGWHSAGQDQQPETTQDMRPADADQASEVAERGERTRWTLTRSPSATGFRLFNFTWRLPPGPRLAPALEAR
jgi:hypothetical protein